jgi:DNA-binding MarR family transcriptional regulator
VTHVKEDFGDGPGGGGPFDNLAFLLSQLGFVASRGFHQALAPLGIEPRHFLLMRHVMRAEGRSQQVLGEMLTVPPSRMVAIVDQLEERGLLERRSNPSDRRARALYLTPAGRRLMGKAFQVAVEYSAGIGATLGPEERRQLVVLLQKVAAEKHLLEGVHPGLTMEDPKAG